jgi:hypothetical protein
MVVLITSAGSRSCGRRAGSTLTGVGVADVVVVLGADDVAVGRELVDVAMLVASSPPRSSRAATTATTMTNASAPPMRYHLPLLRVGACG